MYIVLVAIAFAIISIFNVFESIKKLNKERLALKENEKIIAGQYIAKRCDSSMKLFLPHYSYIDQSFKNFSVKGGYSFNESHIDNSDILILNSSVPGIYIWPTKNGGYKKGKHYDTESQYNLFYNKVFNNPDFINVYQGDTVIVFVRKSKLSMCAFK